MKNLSTVVMELKGKNISEVKKVFEGYSFNGCSEVIVCKYKNANCDYSAYMNGDDSPFVQIWVDENNIITKTNILEPDGTETSDEDILTAYQKGFNLGQKCVKFAQTIKEDESLSEDTRNKLLNDLDELMELIGLKNLIKEENCEEDCVIIELQ